MDITNTPTPGVQTKEDTIEELNDVTRLMIDSYKGYQAACEECDDSFALANEFQERAQRRGEYINEVQNYVRQLGGEPSTHGTARGAVHRGWMNFANIFRDDERGAIDSVEDGESFLAHRIQDCLDDGQLDDNAREILTRAHSDVKAAERFFDMLDEAA
ncbi:MAG: PA2169 family four-helix-bundle protein [Hyphomonadaceae bacterium]|nr:PA2169 family four-helix-bundle protein [Hyphomonadaceae bacterium]